MLKKRVLTVSLSLLACLCCCFSGFGSVNAYAFSIPLSSVPIHSDAGVNERFYYWFSQDYNSNDYVNIPTVYDGGEYSTEFNISSDTNVYNVGFAFRDTGFTYSYNFDSYDYYFAFNLFLSSDNSYYNSPTGMFVAYYDSQNVYKSVELLNLRSSVNKTQGVYKSVLSVIGQLPNNIDLVSLFELSLRGGSGYFAQSTYNEYTKYLYQVPKGTDVETVNSLISAINNQTGALQGSIDQAADDLQQSIEDQYQMEDEEDFGFSDIQQEYEEKMGVLTFGTETTIQMLELFSPSNAGEAYIRVPGWTMEVQGETYQIWDEYIFYFYSIEENFPFLVTTMRTFTVAMFYVAIVGYITKVYERNFLAK